MFPINVAFDRLDFDLCELSTIDDLIGRLKHLIGLIKLVMSMRYRRFQLENPCTEIKKIWELSMEYELFFSGHKRACSLL